jgi:hypothetical protein
MFSAKHRKWRNLVKTMKIVFFGWYRGVDAVLSAQIYRDLPAGCEGPGFGNLKPTPGKAPCQRPKAGRAWIACAPGTGSIGDAHENH